MQTKCTRTSDTPTRQGRPWRSISSEHTRFVRCYFLFQLRRRNISSVTASSGLGCCCCYQYCILYCLHFSFFPCLSLILRHREEWSKISPGAISTSIPFLCLTGGSTKTKENRRKEVRNWHEIRRRPESYRNIRSLNRHRVWCLFLADEEINLIQALHAVTNRVLLKSLTTTFPPHFVRFDFAETLSSDITAVVGTGNRIDLSFNDYQYLNFFCSLLFPITFHPILYYPFPLPHFFSWLSTLTDVEHSKCDLSVYGGLK